jgi:preprotein translocase subunit SecE
MPVFGGPLSWKFLLCAAIFVAGLVLLRRYLARPATVDTLIETEQEMKKVSWPTRDESMNATWVVILVSVVLTVTLVFFDAVLTRFLGFFF